MPEIPSPGIAQAVISELHDFLNDAAGAHYAALYGVRLVCNELTRLEDKTPAGDGELILGFGNPSTPESRAYQRWELASIPGRLADDGPVARTLSQQWIVMVATAWEHSYRPRLAEARGVDTSEIRETHFADVWRMRNDVVHHHGIATAANTGRCEVLQWAEAGEPILVTYERVAEFMDHVGLVEHPDGEDGPRDPPYRLI